jgi:hypothetical protein
LGSQISASWQEMTPSERSTIHTYAHTRFMCGMNLTHQAPVIIQPAPRANIIRRLAQAAGGFEELAEHQNAWCHVSCKQPIFDKNRYGMLAHEK